MKNIIKEEDKYYCKICKLNIENNSKHFYSIKHLENIKYHLIKAKEDLNKYKLFFELPLLIQDDYEQPLFWCKFCQREFKSLKTEIQFVADFIFKHLNHKTHIKKVDYFWNVNKPYVLKDKKDKVVFNKRDFCLDEEQMQKYHYKCADILRKYNDKKRKLDTIEVTNKQHINKEDLDKEDIKKSKQKNNLNTVNTSSYLIKSINGKNSDTKIKKLINNSETLQSLTKINLPSKESTFKNVFEEGNVPPWLQPLSATSKVYGPSIQGFLKMIKKKDSKVSKKLRQEDAGIDTDNLSNIQNDWLPKFGAVWKDGTRKQQREDFLKGDK